MKPGDEGASRSYAPEESGPIDLTNPQLAAKERAKRRSQITADLLTEESRGGPNDISAAEVTYEVSSTSVKAYLMASNIGFFCSFPQIDER